jgi:hypothetical protein
MKTNNLRACAPVCLCACVPVCLCACVPPPGDVVMVRHGAACLAASAAAQNAEGSKGRLSSRRGTANALVESFALDPASNRCVDRYATFFFILFPELFGSVFDFWNFVALSAGSAGTTTSRGRQSGGGILWWRAALCWSCVYARVVSSSQSCTTATATAMARQRLTKRKRKRRRRRKGRRQRAMALCAILRRERWPSLAMMMSHQ